MASLKKKIKLVVAEGNNTILVTETLRVDFEVTISIGEALNVASIEVYNLNKDLISLLASDRQYSVTIEVGDYQSNDLDLLFRGDLINVHHTPMFEDVITTLYCWERGMDSIHNFNSATVTYSNRTLRQIVESIVGDVSKKDGTTYSINYDLATRADVTIPNFTSKRTHISTIVQLLKEYNMIMAIRGDTIYISDALDTETKADEIANSDKVDVLLIRPELLKKPIQFSIVEAEVVYELSPRIKPLDIITIDDAKIQNQLSGYDPITLKLVKGITNILPRTNYFLMSVTHTGSIYTDDWNTTLKGIVYTKTKGG